MKSNLKKFEDIFSISSIILIIAGLYIFTNAPKNLISTCMLILISIAFLCVSYLFTCKIKNEKVSDTYELLGFGFIILSYVNLGYSKLLGEYFSLIGEGRFIFLASLSILVGFLAILMYLKRKNILYIYILYLALLGCLLSFLIHFKVDLNYLLIAVNVIILILSFSKTSFFKYLLMISGILSTFYLGLFDLAYHIEVILCITLFIESIRLAIDKDDVLEVFASVIFFLNAVYFKKLMFDLFDINIAILMTVFIVSIVNLIVNCLDVFKSTVVIVFYRIFYILTMLYLFFVMNDLTLFPLALASLIIIVTSVVDASVYKKEASEKYILPFKVLICTSMLLSALPIKIDDLVFNVGLNLVALLMLYIYRDEKIKKVISIIIGLLIVNIIINIELNLLSFIGYAVLFFIDMLILISSKKSESKEINYVLGIIYSVFLFYGTYTVSVSGIEFIILAISYALFAYAFRENKVLSGIYFVGTLLSLYNYLYMLNINEYVFVVIFTFLFYTALALFTEYYFAEKNKDVVLTISLIIWFLFIKTNAVSIVIILATSIAMIFIGIKNNKYKWLYKGGIAGVIISFLNMLRYIEGINLQIVIIVLGAASLIAAVIFMIKESKETGKKVFEKEEIKVIQGQNNYCSNCGAKINGEKFCGECGHKL